MKNKTFAIQSILRTTENLAKRCQIYGQSQSLASHPRVRLVCVGTLLLLMVCVGCGGGGFNPQSSQPVLEFEPHE